MGYAVWFERNKTRYKLPVNPEEIEEIAVLAMEKYNVLKLGQIAVPTGLELREYSFEFELPRAVTHYVVTADKFKGPEYYLDKFHAWREKLLPVRFAAAHDSEINGVSKFFDNLVLIEELTIIEKASEEGDIYVKIKLIEYKEFAKQPAKEIVYSLSNTKSVARKKATSPTPAVNPKSTDYYVVKSGDSLWSIAKNLYGDGSKCNIIFNANKDKIKNPGLISVGWKLKIPNEDEFKKYSAPLPTEKKATKTTPQKSTVKKTGFELGIAGIASVLDNLYP